MRFHVGWLRDHVELTDDVATLAARLTSLGFAVEGREGHGDDVVLDVDVTSNRPDALSHVGLARELAAASGRQLRMPAVAVAEAPGRIEDTASLVVEAPDLCPRYAMRVVRGVTVAPSPSWMARRLEACGIRPINVIVDVTNWVLLELGHPLHAFDLARLAGRRIVVRRAVRGEKLATLDGQERELLTEDLVIADTEAAVAVAGVMGGLSTEIRDTTRDVLLESAWFQPSAVRRTARRLGLQTEASYRFERGADPDVVPVALDRAAGLLAELAGGSVAEGTLEASAGLPPLRSVRLRAARLLRLGGVAVPDDAVARTLAALGFEPTPQADGWSVTVPRRRADVSREADLVEEVLRHHGYDNVPETLPPFAEGAAPRSPQEGALAALHAALVGAGYHQAVHFTFGDPREQAAWADSVAEDGAARALALDNPLGANISVMRTSLVPGLLRSVSASVRHGEPDVRLFEQGRIYLARRPGAPAPSPAEERPVLAVVATGRRGPGHHAHRPPEVDFASVAGAVLDALSALRGRQGGVPVDVVAGPAPHGAPGASAVLMAGGIRVGWIARIHPDALRPLEIESPLLAAEVDLTTLLPKERVRAAFTALSRFPRVVRDVSLLVDGSLPYGDILAAIRGLRGRGEAALADAIESCDLIDRYVGQGIPAGKVSLTLSLSYRRADRTLLQDEVDAMHQHLVEHLERTFGAVRR